VPSTGLLNIAGDYQNIGWITREAVNRRVTTPSTAQSLPISLLSWGWSACMPVIFSLKITPHLRP
jgi:hypothetical protein